MQQIWSVRGADRQSGESKVVMVVAASEDEAARRALQQGIRADVIRQGEVPPPPPQAEPLLQFNRSLCVCGWITAVAGVLMVIIGVVQAVILLVQVGPLGLLGALNALVYGVALVGAGLAMRTISVMALAMAGKST